MGGLFGNLVFLNPWALTALAGLPALYFLLRVMPPAPRLLRFPAIRFLQGLEPQSKTPSHTPWWILLLRLLMATLLLLALAHPVINPKNSPITQVQPLRLVIDNGWASAQNWDALMDAAQARIAQAGRQQQTVTLLTTAPESTPQKRISGAAPMGAGEALSLLKALKPVPWENDLAALAHFLEADKHNRAFKGETLWLSDGLEKPGAEKLAQILASAGPLALLKPQDQDLPPLLKAGTAAGQTLSVRVESAGNLPSATIQLLNERQQVIDERLADFHAQGKSAEILFTDLPESLQNHAAGYRIAGVKGAQALYLMDMAGGRKNVGILAAQDAGQTRMLAEDSFYLQKALEPYASLTTGTLDEILAHKPALIILPDIGAMPGEHLNALDEWVRGGGLLLRFAGPNMTREHQSVSLTPVPLRAAARTLEGSLSWDKPLHLSPFQNNSPLYGLSIPDDIVVREQILPKTPDAPGLEIWAQMEDGTPLITAAPLGAGMLVMVHTSASPAWSTLALSGLYVEILKRILKLSGQGLKEQILHNGMAQPGKILDGFGALHPPGAEVQPIDAADFDAVIPRPEHPPGLYGKGGLQKALNLGDHLDAPVRLRSLDAVSDSGNLSGVQEKDLLPALLSAALLLFLLDTLVVILLSFNGRLPTRLRRAAHFVLLIGLLSALPAQAQDAVTYAGGLHLAYIKTGNAALDAQNQKGLETLAAVLGERTSAEPLGVAAVDPEHDELSFFPLLYWALSPEQTKPSAAAVQNLQSYLNHGGTILIDTRNGDPGDSTGSPLLRKALAGLDIPPLAPLPEGHVLGRSFYLLDNFPGRHNGAIWVEQQSLNGRDGVSSVIIGGNDWAGAWASINPATHKIRRYNVQNGREAEISLRAGINFILYALTGNYKADQVHVPYILERLGK
ncbi:MAG: DUF4159 domain-containing protein [Alphaproteobacteria bacterium]|nr:DUF4159 domain-containing protein [Alphaproteobacteria bacterium]